MMRHHNSAELAGVRRPYAALECGGYPPPDFSMARRGGALLRIAAQVYDFSDDDIDEITSELRELLAQRRYLTLGEHGKRFESAFAKYHRAPFGIATSSGTAALEIILRHIGVADGEVVMPTNTFAATAFAVLAAGAVPVFADVGDDLTLAPESAAARITPRTRAVITVHIGGLVSPATAALVELCRARGIALVEDAAHAHGSALDGQFAGTFGVAGAFSFFTTKVMTTGEGGMVLTADESLRTAGVVLRDQAKVDGRNYHERAGYNWRLSELHAILGEVQVRRLDEFIARRQAIAHIYDRLLADVPGITPLCRPSGVRHNYYKYICLLERISPVDLSTMLKRRFDISTGGYVYDVPLHEQPAFRSYANGPLPCAEELCRRHICLPLYPSLTDEQALYVGSAVSEILKDF
jgi:dTDP-4-amino-4,6-dideoxygalactose transaminase